MQNGSKTMRRRRQPGLARDYAARSKRSKSGATRSPQNGSPDARRSYQRYLALAEAQALSGDVVAAENYYQHAEHYFRSLSLDC